jgi:formate hydrogenlyase subunit 6/NADH:ubiquinone oxidoreductase subunit I
LSASLKLSLPFTAKHLIFSVWVFLVVKKGIQWMPPLVKGSETRREIEEEKYSKNMKGMSVIKTDRIVAFCLHCKWCRILCPPLWFLQDKMDRSGWLDHTRTCYSPDWRRWCGLCCLSWICVVREWLQRHVEK